MAALDAADGILERLPADQETAARLAAAVIRLTASLRSGDLAAAAAAAARAEMLASRVPGGKLARDPDIRARVLSGRGAVELWSGHLDEAARVLESAVAAASASGGEDERADCLWASGAGGGLARTAAPRRGPGRPGDSGPAAGEQRPPASSRTPRRSSHWPGCTWNTMSCARRAAGSSRRTPPSASARTSWWGRWPGWRRRARALAEGRAAAAAQIVARARSGWPVPAWLDHRLSLAESRACAAAGDIEAALAAARRAGRDTSPEAAVTLAHAWAAAGDGENARRALAPALAANSGTPDRVRLQAWLVDARLRYTSGDRARGRRSLASALRLAEPEQLRLPFAIERSWIGPVLRRDPELARAHRGLLPPALFHDQLPAPQGAPDQAPMLAAEPLTEREREVLRHVAGLLSNAEAASEMYISVNTVKTHLKHIYRKLATTRRGEAIRRARQLELI